MSRGDWEEGKYFAVWLNSAQKQTFMDKIFVVERELCKATHTQLGYTVYLVGVSRNIELATMWLNKWIRRIVQHPVKPTCTLL